MPVYWQRRMMVLDVLYQVLLKMNIFWIVRLECFPEFCYTFLYRFLSHVIVSCSLYMLLGVYRVASDFVTTSGFFIPEVIPSQKCHMNIWFWMIMELKLFGIQVDLNLMQNIRVSPSSCSIKKSVVYFFLLFILRSQAMFFFFFADFLTRTWYLSHACYIPHWILNISVIMHTACMC